MMDSSPEIPLAAPLLLEIDRAAEKLGLDKGSIRAKIMEMLGEKRTKDNVRKAIDRVRKETWAPAIVTVAMEITMVRPDLDGQKVRENLLAPLENSKRSPRPWQTILQETKTVIISTHQPKEGNELGPDDLSDPYAQSTGGGRRVLRSGKTFS